MHDTRPFILWSHRLLAWRSATLLDRGTIRVQQLMTLLNTLCSLCDANRDLTPSEVMVMKKYCTPWLDLLCHIAAAPDGEF